MPPHVPACRTTARAHARRCARRLTVVVAVLSTIVFAAPATAGTKYERERHLKVELAELSSEEARLLQELRRSEPEAHRLDAAARQLDAKIHERGAWLEEAAARRDDLLAEERLVRRRYRDAKGDLGRARRALIDQAVDVYVSGTASSAALNLLLSVRDAHELATAKALVEVAVKGKDAAIERYREAADEVEGLYGEARSRRLDAEELRDEIAANRQTLVDERGRVGRLRGEAHEAASAHRAAVRSVRARQAAYQSELAALAQASGSIEQELAELQPGRGGRPAKRGTLAPPVVGASVSSNFGPRVHPIFGTGRLHAGVDYAAPTGTPIVAPADGKVFSATDRGGYGLTVVIDHGGALATVYAHMSGFAVDAGDKVRRGQVIGYVGSTGQSTGPHLHFEARIAGTPVDPAAWL